MNEESGRPAVGDRPAGATRVLSANSELTFTAAFGQYGGAIKRSAQMVHQPDPQIYIVAIGASADGIEAISALL
jgi:chemotaxis response regulator CheB